MFTLIGCNDYAWLTSLTISQSILTGCMAFCSHPEEVVGGDCSGNGCCQTPIPKDIKYFNTQLNTFGNSSGVRENRDFNPCAYAFVGDPTKFKFNGAADFKDASFDKKTEATVPLVFNWAIGNMSCPEVQKTHAFACQANSVCINSTETHGGYRCICNQGYQGNPYLSPGCQDINECEHSEKYPCNGNCVNTQGSYNCTCPQGSIGDAKKDNGCQHVADAKVSSTIYIIIALVCALLAILCGGGIWFCMKRKKLARLREKFFEQNGGVLLKQRVGLQGAREATILFSPKQLLKATNSYSQEHIIGRGASGVVYKGVLSDERVVAVKKSKVVDATQVDQFVNEVLILTQVIHRNVVKLLGCCLEEEVPILVYEFISNNTLFHHIHHEVGGMSWLTWENRLRVAAEAASALAYLHSETNMPIIHRDVKSSNILIDSNYTTKISDFGASRLVPIDHEQVTTLVQGTIGYLDPEYFNTSQLTPKSDVYSYGVVLAELITGKKVIGTDRENREKNLATYFVTSVRENRLYDIVEPRIVCGINLEQLLAVGDLVKRCLNLQGEDRPSMKEVVAELDVLRKLTSTASQVLELEQPGIL